MRSLRERLGITLLSGVRFCAFLPGCDSGGPGLEKPATTTDLKPDMNKMPGFNDMQKELGKKGIKPPAEK